MSLNRAELIGNVTRDPEVHYTAGGQPVVTFGVATDFYSRAANGERVQHTEFHNIVCWNIGKRPLAEQVSRYVRKGSKVYVAGRLQTRQFEVEAGHKRWSTEIIANDVVFLDRPDQRTSPAGIPPLEESTPREVDPELVPF